jgi:hypothetical protein
MEVSFGKVIEPKYWDVQLPCLTRFWPSQKICFFEFTTKNSRI